MPATRASDERLAPAQLELASGIRDRLTRAGARFLQRTESNGRDAWIRFTIDTRKTPGLDVELIVGPGVFEFVANTADLRILEPANPRGWVEESLRTLEALLADHLRIRVRRKFFGGTTGAVRVPPGYQHWNGDLFAYLGFGRETGFPDWFGGPPARPGDEHSAPPTSAPSVKHPFRLADSVVLGATALLLVVSSLLALLTWDLGEDRALIPMAVIMTSPALAGINAWFAMRDSRNGRPAQAVLGLVLSAFCLMAGYGPLLLAD